MDNMIISEIVKAAHNRKTVLISYRDRKGKITVREIEPYEFKEDALYGFCLTKLCIHRFKVDNILFAEMTDNTFIPRWPVKI